MENVKLLSSWVSYFGMRVQIALEEKEIPYDLQEEDFFNKSQLLLNMNPIYKKIPVLIHEGKPVVESLVIVQYIDDAWPSNTTTTTTNFLPSKPGDRATARFWADFIDKKFYDAGSRIVRGVKGKAQEEAKRDMVGALTILEKALVDSGKPYFGGEEFGYVDIAFIPFTSWFHTYETVGDFHIRLKDNFRRIDKWMGMCMQRESVRKVLPHPAKVLDFILQLRKRLAISPTHTQTHIPLLISIIPLCFAIILMILKFAFRQNAKPPS